MDWDPYEAMKKCASTSIKRLSRELSLGSGYLLTGFCAMLAPEIDPYKNYRVDSVRSLESIGDPSISRLVWRIESCLTTSLI